MVTKIKWILLITIIYYTEFLSGCCGQESYYWNTLLTSFETFHKFKSLGKFESTDTRKTIETLEEMSKFLDFGKQADSTVSFIAADQQNDVTGNCTVDISRILSGAGRAETWAVEMIDATGKPESYILGGSTKWVGAYDECLRVEPVAFKTFPGNQTNLTESYVPFKPQYCWTTITPSPPISIPALGIPYLFAEVGMCLPDSCSNSDIMKELNDLFSMQPVNNGTRFRVTKVECRYRPEIDNVAIVAIVVLGFFALLSLFGTGVDIFFLYFPTVESLPSPSKEQNTPKEGIMDTKFSPDEKTPLVRKDRQDQGSSGNGILRRILVSFSLYTNGKKLLSTTQSSDSLTALNGVRFLSISWVVLGHCYGFVFNNLKNGVLVYQEMVTRWTFQPIINAFVSVDSFFALSGLLLAYLTLKEIDRLGGVLKFNWAMFYFHRFWRLTPVYMLVMLADIGLYRYLGDGPFWTETGAEIDQCRESWWWNLLYINNFEVIKDVQPCFGHAWYLANDMQFFVLSPLMLIPLYLHGIIGLCVCMLFLLGTWIATGLISTHYDLPPSASGRKNIAEEFEYYYIKPWCRMGPYIAGIIWGYLLYRYKGRIRINKLINLLIWAVMTTLAIVVLYGLHDYFNGDDMETEVASLFNTTHRTVWGVCVCWVIFACATGHGGFVNTLLSWGAFSPLARLSYCLYLVHPFVIYSYNQSQRQLFYLTDNIGIYLFLSSLVLSIMVAFVASLLFEAPMLGLEKVIFKRGERRKP